MVTNSLDTIVSIVNIKASFVLWVVWDYDQSDMAVDIYHIDCHVLFHCFLLWLFSYLSGAHSHIWRHLLHITFKDQLVIGG